MGRLKAFGWTTAGWAMMLGLGAIPAFYLLGAEWFAGKALPTLYALCAICFALDVLLLPVAIVRVTRSFVGTAVIWSSLLFGLTSWLTSMVVTQHLWGMWAVVLGLVMFGGAVVPFAMLASLFAGEWSALGLVVGLFGVTWIARFGGGAICALRYPLRA